MFVKCSNLNSRSAHLNGVRIAFLLGLIPASSWASDFQFFGKGIDYWHLGTPDPKIEAVAPVKGAPSAWLTDAAAGDKTKGGALSGGAFPWHQYLDPKNKEFFKEGDYTPPEPFMELVRNPSDYNLKMWFDYIEKKNELSGRLQTRIQEYVAQKQSSVPSDERDKVLARANVLPKAAPNIKRYRFRMYFDSHCPHCKRMFGTLTDLQLHGYFVEARQVDGGSGDLRGIPFPIERASPTELKDKAIQSVPVLLVGDLTRKVVYRINGYQTIQQVLNALPKEEEQ